LLLRVYHEAMLEKRGSATVRQRSSVLGDRAARSRTPVQKTLLDEEEGDPA
jgi:hypothetical protein